MSNLLLEFIIKIFGDIRGYVILLVTALLFQLTLEHFGFELQRYRIGAPTSGKMDFSLDSGKPTYFGLKNYKKFIRISAVRESLRPPTQNSDRFSGPLIP